VTKGGALLDGGNVAVKGGAFFAEERNPPLGLTA